MALALVSGLRARAGCAGRGATAVEYALLVTFVAAAIVGAVTAIGTWLGLTFNDLVARWPAH
ncbi:Flp family type IVb pilin [Nocardioides sp. GY 10113]|uniref:Flp family type IVb pilin n=1 Tax=Nocardioides sp. GY 10113 TaxID=2569761 RepID=UPI0010A87C23|nr:Flp family type IVb pilin [Nocardioides sp. GY 10113]TIC81300.1 Flp family type IVb pilin [Nocardioides sp. GY 10113]